MFGVISGCGRNHALLRAGMEDASCCGRAAGLRGKTSCGVFNLFHLRLQTRPWPSERLGSRRKWSRTLCSHVQAGVWVPCLWPLHPSRQLSGPGLGAPAAAGCGARAWSLPWGRPGRARPEAEERGRSPLLCYAIHLYFGVFDHSGQKAPPTLWSLRGRLTGTVSPGSTRPSAQLHWPAVRPAPLGRGRGAPSAPRGWTPCHPGRFLHSTLLFLLSRDFPPRLLNKHCFSALARFAGWRVQERGLARVGGAAITLSP